MSILPVRAEMKEAHPLTEYIPARADFDQLVMEVAQRGGMREPVVLYEGKIIEGRVRYRATLEAGYAPHFRDWVLLTDREDPLDWMVHHHIASHELSELDRIRLVSSVLPHYRTMEGSAHQRLNRATGVSWNKVRAIDWLLRAGKLDQVLSGDKDLLELSRELGIWPERREIALGKSYGKGDKFDEATQPLSRYLTVWKRKNYEFRHVNPKEAQRRLSVIDQLVADLSSARSDLERRSVVATLTAPPERKPKP